MALGSCGLACTNRGGGAIRIDSLSTVHIAAGAHVSANAVNSHNSWGQGSGGSVWISCQHFSGAGTVEAAAAGNYRYRGSGGRVAVVAGTESTFTGTLQAPVAVTGTPNTPGNRGTVYYSAPGQVTLEDGSALVVPAGATVMDFVIAGQPVYSRVEVGEGATLGIAASSVLQTPHLHLAVGASLVLHADSSQAAPPPTQVMATSSFTMLQGATIHVEPYGLAHMQVAAAVALTAAGVRVDVEGSLHLEADSLQLGASGAIVGGGDSLINITTTGDCTLTGSVTIDTASIDASIVIAAKSGHLSIQASVAAPRVSIVAANLTLAPGARLHSDGLSAQVTQGAPSPNSNGGCAHGANAYARSGFVPGAEYGNPLEPRDLGCSVVVGSRVANRGGGALRIVVTDVMRMQVASSVSADTAYLEKWHGRGAGGSVWITAGRLSGEGRISASAPTFNSNSVLAAGTGGRIAIYTQHLPSPDAPAYAGTIEVRGQTDNEFTLRRDGTVFLCMPGVVVLGNCSGAVPVVDVPSGAVYESVYTGSDNYAMPSLTVHAGGLLELALTTLQTAAITVEDGAQLQLTVHNVKPDSVVQWDIPSTFNLAGTLAAYDVALVLDGPGSTFTLVTGRVISTGSITMRLAQLHVGSTTSIEAEHALDVQVNVLTVATSAAVKTTATATGTLSIAAATRCDVQGEVSAANVLITGGELVVGQLGAVHADSLGHDGYVREGWSRKSPYLLFASLHWVYLCHSRGRGTASNIGCSHGGHGVVLDGSGQVAAAAYGDPYTPTTQGCGSNHLIFGGGVVRVSVNTVELVHSLSRYVLVSRLQRATLGRLVFTCTLSATTELAPMAVPLAHIKAAFLAAAYG